MFILDIIMFFMHAKCSIRTSKRYKHLWYQEWVSQGSVEEHLLSMHEALVLIVALGKIKISQLQRLRVMGPNNLLFFPLGKIYEFFFLIVVFKIVSHSHMWLITFALNYTNLSYCTSRISNIQQLYSEQGRWQHYITIKRFVPTSLLWEYWMIWLQPILSLRWDGLIAILRGIFENWSHLLLGPIPEGTQQSTPDIKSDREVWQLGSVLGDSLSCTFDCPG